MQKNISIHLTPMHQNELFHQRLHTAGWLWTQFLPVTYKTKYKLNFSVWDKHCEYRIQWDLFK